MADPIDYARADDASGAAAHPLRWTPAWRAVVFCLSASSIWCLLSDFYHVMSMRAFALSVMLPSTAVLVGLAVWDKVLGGRTLWRVVLIGAAAGLVAAVAYDVFRLPFVFAREWGISHVVPPLNLYRVFPRFGAMLLGNPLGERAYSPAEQVLGWAYHFSNGLTFGVMYLSLIGDGRRRSWLWAVVFAVGLELAMLYTPYPSVYGIKVTAAFVAATMAAHAIFGVVMGLVTRRMSRQWQPSAGGVALAT